MPFPKLKSIGKAAPALPGLKPGAMTRLLSIVLAVAFWVLIVLTVVFCILFAVFTFVPVGSFTLTSGNTSVPLPRAYILLGWGAFAGYFGGFAFILHRLNLMVRTLRMGDPFQPANVNRLRQIALTLAVVTGAAFFGQTLVSRLVRGGLEPPSLIDLITPAFSILVVLVLAQVFVEGARLRRESELTI